MTTTHTWKGWYFVDTTNLASALRDAREQASKDHPTTPITAMMTPQLRRVSTGTRVMVVGKPSS